MGSSEGFLGHAIFRLWVCQSFRALERNKGTHALRTTLNFFCISDVKVGSTKHASSQRCRTSPITGMRRWTTLRGASVRQSVSHTHLSAPLLTPMPCLRPMQCCFVRCCSLRCHHRHAEFKICISCCQFCCTGDHRGLCRCRAGLSDRCP